MEFDALDIPVIKQIIWIAMFELTRIIVFNVADIYLFILSEIFVLKLRQIMLPHYNMLVVL